MPRRRGNYGNPNSCSSGSSLSVNGWYHTSVEELQDCKIVSPWQVELSPDLELVRRRWSTSTLPDLVGRYSDISKSEFTVNSPMLPRALFEADNEVRMLTFFNTHGCLDFPQLFKTYGTDLRRDGGDASRANVSLESNPVVAFLQSLMPWSRVDYTGTEAEPVGPPCFHLVVITRSQINITAGIRGALDRITERLGLGGEPQPVDEGEEEEENGMVNDLGDRGNLEIDDDEDPLIQRILLEEVTRRLSPLCEIVAVRRPLVTKHDEAEERHHHRVIRPLRISKWIDVVTGVFLVSCELIKRVSEFDSYIALGLVCHPEKSTVE